MTQVEQGRPTIKFWGMIVVVSLQSLHAQGAWGRVQALIRYSKSGKVMWHWGVQSGIRDGKLRKTNPGNCNVGLFHWHPFPSKDWASTAFGGLIWAEWYPALGQNGNSGHFSEPFKAIRDLIQRSAFLSWLWIRLLHPTAEISSPLARILDT